MSGKDQITGRQIAAARALIGLAQDKLAKQASVSIPTLRRMEANKGAATGLANNVAAIRAALEIEGIIFVEENGEGPGVRLRKAGRIEAPINPVGPATDVVKQMDAAIKAHETKRKR